jgi:dolichol-phosphate mannosyltransferase
MTALNETGKIGRTVDGIPRDGRFEPVVIDDGSTDGTSDEARAHGATVLRHEVNQGVGGGLRTGIAYARSQDRPYIAFFAGDDQHVGSDLARCLDFVLAGNYDYVQGSRWMRGGRVEGPTGGRGFGTRLYAWIFSVLVLRRVTDATNGFRIFRTSLLDDPAIDISQPWLNRYELEPYLLYHAVRGRYHYAEFPVTVRYHREGYTKMRGVRDWWRLLRPAILLRLHLKR